MSNEIHPDRSAPAAPRREPHVPGMRTVCVFCGSTPGADPAYVEMARRFGALVATTGRRIVFGGGALGLMGALADGAVAAGGTVIGIIPRGLLKKEIGHPDIAELRVVESMHERKALMSELADGFVALPGGIGTLEELFEIWTWGQLGLHRKPCGLLEVNGFFDPLLAFLDHVVEQKFVRPEHRAILLVDRDGERLLDRMEARRPAAVTPRWIDRATA